jgi:cyclopropane fatty-acyl-phospholipid synthase-like methyltransferase
VPEAHAPSQAAVAAFYDNVAAVEVIFGESIHWGYWPVAEEYLSLAEAQNKLTDLVAAKSGAQSGMRVLDVGCGTGAPACKLARTTGASVTGVTISPKQAEVATARSAKAGLTARVEFQVADAVSLPFADATFDAAIAIESIMHMADQPSALREIFRVLRPGAAMAIADFTRRTAEFTLDTETPLGGLVAVPTQDDYMQMVSQAGFHVEDILDVGERTKASYEKLIQRLAAQRSELTAACGEEQAAALEQNFEYGAAIAEDGKMSYLLLTARKPASQA